ncbi:MAG: hypothetical protein R3350_08765, partial [Saprospiraceae bacterium]|nr:hypothetical protein [Saprospiraceae bacterium]
ERRQEKPKIILVVRDNQDNVVRKMDGPTRKGFHRVAWDLRHSSKNAVRLGESSGFFDRGFPAVPGTYTVSLHKLVDGQTTQLAGPVQFEVERLREGALEPMPLSDLIAFRENLEGLMEEVSATSSVMSEAMERVEAMQVALARTSVAGSDLHAQLHNLKQSLIDLDIQMNGDKVKGVIGERTDPTIRGRMFVGYRALNTTYGPTPLHKENLAIAQRQLAGVKEKLTEIQEGEMVRLEKELQSIGAPWIEGQPLPRN